jgi:hypothetical protein
MLIAGVDEDGRGRLGAWAMGGCEMHRCDDEPTKGALENGIWHDNPRLLAWIDRKRAEAAERERIAGLSAAAPCRPWWRLWAG